MFGTFDVVEWYLYRLSIFGFVFFDFCSILSVCFVEEWVVDVVGIMFFVCLDMRCNFV